MWSFEETWSSGEKQSRGAARLPWRCRGSFTTMLAPTALWKYPGVQHLEFKLRDHSHKHRGDFSPIISTRLLSCAKISLGASLCLTRSQYKCWGTSSYKAGPKRMEQLRASRMIWKDRLTVTLLFFQFYVMTSQKNAVKLSHILPLCAALWVPECYRCPEMGDTLVQLGG